MLQCYIQDDSNYKIATSNALYKSSFLADLWTGNDDFSLGVYVPNYDGDNIDIGIHSKSKAAAVGSATATVDSHSSEYSTYDEYFELDNYTLELDHKS